MIFSVVLVLSFLNGSGIYCFLSSTWSENGDVITLTNQNFKSKAKEHDVLLVMFYVKWCSHCRRLHPDYERAATQLSMNTDYPIHIAKFDCTNDNEAQCSARYNIDGFPTLRIYRYGQFRGEELNYLNRTTDEIIKTMKTLKKASGQQGQTQFYSYQTDGIKDEMNRATTSAQYMWLFIGLLYGILQKYFI
ncbi:unnamed protein product [Adineta steineri]|uniref:Thioredoxin domain-containing protein n=1 Tax=Adineta steineri TaxID=433720 RepID=A0A819Q2F3_9BILA|nr:unnamed protein product [Adineta steineri]CAF4018105.1 unnamed protein product [Adineta steineri]